MCREPHPKRLLFAQNFFEKHTRTRVQCSGEVKEMKLQASSASPINLRAAPGVVTGASRSSEAGGLDSSDEDASEAVGEEAKHV